MPPKLKKPLAAPKYSLFRELQNLGYRSIIGVDEVGRGALAGPVVVAAVEVKRCLDGITDSKLLAKSQRTNLAQLLHQDCLRIRFGTASNQEIDQIGMKEALRRAYSRALKTLKADLVLTDHYSLPTDHRFIRATHGDSLFYPVAAASIVAKVHRDQLMSIYHRFYPDYHWDQNAGYATKSHRHAIQELGFCPLHRTSFCLKG